MIADKKRMAAIDIGSNAIRMMIAEATPRGLRRLKKYRIPIRLGADVFEKGKISGKNLKASAHAFEKFQNVSQKMGVTRLRAVGTSALREAKNQASFVELIRRQSGIRIEVIDGVEEARLIHLAVSHELHLDGHRSLLIDIGGGSVELTFSENGLMTSTQSFPFGTVRTLELMRKKNLNESQLNVVMGEFISPLSHFIHSQSSSQSLDFAIGTGGNLEALGKLKNELLKKNSRGTLSLRELDEIIDGLRKFSVRERIEKLGLRPDRADVILPASMLVQAVLRQASLEKLLIPEVGVRDGLMWSMLSSRR